MDGSFALSRLKQERKEWRKTHPYGFVARPTKNENQVLDYFEWDCIVPGKKGTLWEGGKFKMKLYFPEDYPASPPKARFVPPLFHVNCYPSGTVCLSILSDGWKPGINLKQIMLGIQNWFDDPNPESPAQRPALEVFLKDRGAYDQKIREQTAQNL
ncbi:dorsal interacting protein [Anaeramoeba flamelloides]|uniref:SUMO-conjugating enzyme UBC9 n=1 Tax=Anaeramoeba flamelloides TaxID=1746091 RepID=A0AAV7Y586_9EUKA|nr:dorsal interacting protein [Anaeramoeba flamelloides]KAJ6229309.1 dorsal interacting protein [Anaeramoeba flamelloides]